MINQNHKHFNKSFVFVLRTTSLLTKLVKHVNLSCCSNFSNKNINNYKLSWLSDKFAPSKVSKAIICVLLCFALLCCALFGFVLFWKNKKKKNRQSFASGWCHAKDTFSCIFLHDSSGLNLKSQRKKASLFLQFAVIIFPIR